jgi:hypothetical protein
VRPREDVVDPPEALEYNLFDVRGVTGILRFGENSANGHVSILKRQLDLVKAQLDLTMSFNQRL